MRILSPTKTINEGRMGCREYIKPCEYARNFIAQKKIADRLKVWRYTPEIMWPVRAHI